MKRGYWVGGLLAAAVLGVLLYLGSGGHAPAGQAPLEALTPANAGDIKNAFNAAKDDPRLLVFLSPT